MNLDQYIHTNLSKSFEWGVHDCFTFAIGWVSLQTGVDYLSKYGSWHSKASAFRAIGALNGVEKEIGLHLHEVHPKEAKDGDLTLLDNSFMLFFGPKIVGVGDNNLVFKNRDLASCAWSLSQS